MKRILSLLVSLAFMVAVIPKISFADEKTGNISQSDGVSSSVFDAVRKFANGVDSSLISKCGLSPKCTKGVNGKGSCVFDLKCGGEGVGQLPNDELHNTILPDMIDKCGQSFACNMKDDGSGSCTLSLDCNERHGSHDILDDKQRVEMRAYNDSSLSWWEVVKSFSWYHHLLNVFGFLFIGALMFRN